jgi:hypothetical protein
MQAIINGAVFSGRSPDAGQSERLVNGARELLQQATELSESGQA